jgi:acyl carrier protein
MSERIKQVMSHVFGKPTSALPDDPTIDNVPEWDSLRHIELMLALESEFSVHFSTEAMLELLSMDAIAAYLREQGETT